MTVTSSDPNVVVDYVAIHGGKNNSSYNNRVYWGPAESFTATGLQSAGSYSNVYIFFHVATQTLTSTATSVFTGGSPVNGVMSGGTPYDSNDPPSAPASVYDTAMVSNGDNTHGTVTFVLYPGTCPASSPLPTPTGTDANVSLINGVATSTAFSNLAAGSYYFIATYSGSTTTTSSTGPCEGFSVVTPPPTHTSTATSVFTGGSPVNGVMSGGTPYDSNDPPSAPASV
ncbi:MAG TPA: hypothetical protein VFN59_00490, partial [Acidimicrobiales bacterium]|nr:hypothetical protein [Acidimicrobiales bacterium]